MQKLENGTLIYRYCTTAGLFQYVVVGTAELEGIDVVIVDCLACSHGGPKCRVMIQPTEDGKFKYHSMVNHDQESEEYWHNDGHDSTYYLSESKCKISILVNTINWRKDKIKELEDAIFDHKDKIIDHQKAIKLLENA